MSVITQDGWTALMLAAGKGLRDAAVELMKLGADLNLQNNVCRNFLYVVLTNYFMEWLCIC